MDKDTLIANYALIVHKASSLSSTQRQMVKELVALHVGKGRIKSEELAEEVKKLSEMIMAGIKEALDNENSTDKEEITK